MPIGTGPSSSGSTATGFEFGYDQITTGVTVASTTEASGTTIISCAAHTFDGAPVLATFFSPQVTVPQVSAANVLIIISLFEAATQIGRLCILGVNEGAAVIAQITAPCTGMFRFTPTAASHTYTVTAHVSNAAGSPNVAAGGGGVAGQLPAFIRFTKV